MKAFLLSSSPRRDGNSALLAKAARDGLEAAGHEVSFAHAEDVIDGFLRDCRRCHRENGTCAIEDRYAQVFLDEFLPADGVILATPVYWYGMAAQLKAFFDRMFCYVATSYPNSAEVVAAMKGKRIGILISSEETYPTVAAGIIQQIQEYCRYTESSFVGAVQGHGNMRGEVARDPRDPIEAARALGSGLFDALATDYRIDTERSARVWG